MTFGEDGEQSPLGAMALEDAMLATDPQLEAAGTGRDALEMTAAAE